jgi:hypothetical protein
LIDRQRFDRAVCKICRVAQVRRDGVAGRLVDDIDEKHHQRCQRKDQRKQKAATSQALSGKPDMAQVVTAVSNAEVTLQAAVAVRDKVIQAYLDVIRMPI